MTQVVTACGGMFASMEGFAKLVSKGFDAVP